MMVVPWPAALSLISSIGGIYALLTMRSHRDQPGALYWMGFIGAIILWSASYGVGLLVFDPALRRLFEVGIWFGKNLCPLMMLGIGLAYTGRTNLAYSRLMGANAAFWIIAALVYATNPWHGLVWSGYTVTAMFDVATVTYTRQPLLYGFYAFAYLQIGAAALLLFRTLHRAETGYRTQLLAVATGILMPTGTSAVWLLQLGPVPELNLTPVAFTGTVLATTYALFHMDTFEVTPSKVRTKAIEDIPDPFVAVNVDGELTDFNPAAERIIDGLADKRIGQPLEAVAPTLASAIEQEDPSETEVSLETDGGCRQFDLNASTFCGPRGDRQGIQVVLRDITTLKEQAQILRERERKLKRQNERLDQFANVVSHDLRNPLGIAKTYLDFAEETGDQEDFETVRESLTRMETMIDDLLTMARTETTIDDPVAVDLRELADEAWMIVQTDRATFRNEIAEETTVDGDPSLLQNVFENLFRNAVDHNDAPVTVRVGTLVDDHGFYIEDDGSGIPDGHAATIFEFGHTTSEDGFGFGLAIVQELVTAHNWEIAVTDSDEAGARFEIEYS